MSVAPPRKVATMPVSALPKRLASQGAMTMRTSDGAMPAMDAGDCQAPSPK